MLASGMPLAYVPNGWHSPQGATSYSNERGQEVAAQNVQRQEYGCKVLGWRTPGCRIYEVEEELGWQEISESWKVTAQLEM